MINWKQLTKEENATINKIVSRSQKLMRVTDRMSLDMDISAAHLSCPIKLDKLLEADDFNFCHDVAGIVNHIDRTTGELKDCFVPRFAV